LAEIAADLSAASIDAVFAVVVGSTGSAARPRGAMALLDADGMRAGSLGGGELERRLHEIALDVLRNGCAATLDIDAHDDSSHTSSLPGESQGTMQILLLPMPAADSPLRNALVAACAGSAWLRLRLDLGREKETSSELGYGEARTGADVYVFDNRGRPCSGPVEFIRHASLGFAPPPRVVLLGTGPESRALVRMAQLLGWYIEIVDARASTGHYINRNKVDRLHAIAPEVLPTLLAERHFDAAIIGGHDFDIDARHLRHLGATGIG
jgi:xanthine dehydrogenase accessory factor